MNEIVWPCDEAEPSYQVPVGLTAGDRVPAFLKYGCSLRVQSVEVKGKRTRKPRAARLAPA